MWDEMAVDAKARNEMRELIRGMITDWVNGNGKRQVGRCLVVFIDDLDRCSDEVVADICDAVKLYLDVPGLVFVIACDLSVIARDVAAVRPSAMDGRAYLEKIVQVTHRMPPPSSVQIDRLIDGYSERSGTANILDESARQVLAERTGGNPRRIKRIINSVVLEHKLNPRWSLPPLSTSQLVRTILIQHFYPSFYEFLIREAPVGDPIQEFLNYAAVRRGAADPPPPEHPWWSLVDRVFLGRGATAPERGADVAKDLLAKLQRLEQEMPHDFPELAHNQTFCSLLSDLGGTMERSALRDLLLSRPLGVQPVEGGALTGVTDERSANAPAHDSPPPLLRENSREQVIGGSG
jgi:hypothetical protein